MRLNVSADEGLAQRLPLPLARLYRRAHNARTPLELHQAAYYLWEAAVKLLAVAALSEQARRPEAAPELTPLLERFDVPALGHWWGLARDLTASLARRPDSGFARVHDLLTRTALRDLPAARDLDAALRQRSGQSAPAPASRSLQAVFDRLVQYRNEQVGHGAIGQHEGPFYEKTGKALLTALTEILGRLDPLAGRRLVHVAEVRRTVDGWEVSCFELVGEAPKRLDPWQLPIGAALPDVERVYLADGPMDNFPTLALLHPLLIFDADAQDLLCYNGRRAGGRLQYLGYADGRTPERADADGEFPRLLAHLLNRPPTDFVLPDPPESPTGDAAGAATAAPERTPTGPRRKRALTGALAAGLVLLVAALVSLAVVRGLNPPRSATPPTAATNPAGPPDPTPPRKEEPTIVVIKPDDYVLTDKDLGDGVKELCKRAVDLLKGRGVNALRVGTFRGPTYQESGCGAAIKTIVIDALRKRDFLEERAEASIDGAYFPVRDAEDALPALGVRLTLRRAGESLGELPLLRVDDLNLLARMLGVNRRDAGGGHSPEKEGELLMAQWKDPKAAVQSTRIRAEEDSPYALEILERDGDHFTPLTPEVKDGAAFVSVTRPNEEFAINLVNESPNDAAAELTLDGLNVFAFYENPGVRHIVVAKGKTVRMVGWPIAGGQEGRSDRFLFTDYPHSAAAELRADPAKIGTITVDFAAAWGPEEKPPQDEQLTAKDPLNVAVGRGEPVDTPSRLVGMRHGRSRATISVRYQRPGVATQENAP